MIYEGIDRWNANDLEHSVLSRHKYVMKVGKGKDARYFYSMDEYNRYLRSTKTQSQHEKDMYEQDKSLSTLRNSARKRRKEYLDDLQVTNSRIANADSKWRKAHSDGYRSLSSTAKGVGTLKMSAKKTGIKKHSGGTDKSVRRLKRGVKALNNMFGIMSKPRKVANAITNPLRFANAVWRMTGHK